MSTGIEIIPLSLGELTNDLGLPLNNGGLAIPGGGAIEPPMCTQSMASYLILHPKAGPLLYDTGVASNYAQLWPQEALELAAPSLYGPEHRLDNALKAVGYELSDIRGVVVSHLHMDHAGGLEFFRNTNVPVYVHADELKTAFYAIATKEDFGPYLPHYIDHRFNWRPIHGDEWHLFEGIKLYRMGGHTPGMLVMHVELKNHGHWLLTSDQFPLQRNYEEPTPQGWIMRDVPAWWRSVHFTKSLQQRFDARVVFGHDRDDFAILREQRSYD